MVRASTRALAVPALRRSLLVAEVALLVLLLTRPRSVHAQPLPERSPIEHVIVLYLENHTFDNLYGFFPGANGLQDAAARIPQADRTGAVYATLPQPLVSLRFAGLPALPPPIARLIPEAFPDPRFPADLPNAPFLIDPFVPNNELVGTPVHRFYEYQLQINGGRMDQYVAWTDVGGLVMGTYDTTQLPLYPYARRYTLADNFFTAAFGGSFLNHMWLVCACTPVWPNAPAEFIAKPQFDKAGRLISIDDDINANVTPDGYAVNTGIEPFYPPHSGRLADDHRLPPQTFPTIGDRLSERGINWAEYNGGWNNALAGHPDQPLPLVTVPPLASHGYFAPYAPDTGAHPLEGRHGLLVRPVRQPAAGGVDPQTGESLPGAPRLFDRAGGRAARRRVDRGGPAIPVLGSDGHLHHV